MLDRKIFWSILNHFNLSPTLDAFASRSTAQLLRYMSLEKDHLIVTQNALIQSWEPVSYLFPPLPLLLKVIRKIKDQKIRAILVCPQFPLALWWNLMTEILVEPPMILLH